MMTQTKAPRFIFRFDVSPDLGTGHLRRCLALMAELRRRGAEVSVLSRVANFNLAAELAPVTREVHELPWDINPADDVQALLTDCRDWHADAVVLDHYRADADYQQALYDRDVRWLQFHGYAASVPTLADWIVNPHPLAPQMDYATLRQKPGAEALLGPAYAILRAEFAEAHPDAAFRDQANRILLTFGGGNDYGATLFSLEATQRVEPSIERLVLTTSANPGLTALRRWIQAHPEVCVKLLLDAPDIAGRMLGSDIAISAGGMTTFEIAAVGLAGLVIPITDNQSSIVSSWHQIGSVVDLGKFTLLRPEKLAESLAALLHDTPRRLAMAHAGHALVDGQGAVRVAQRLLAGVAGAD